MNRESAHPVFDERVLARKSGVSFLKLWLLPNATLHTNAPDRQDPPPTFRLYDRLSLHVRNVGSQEVTFKVAGAKRNTAQADDSYQDLLTNLTLAPGGLRLIDIDCLDYTVLSLISTGSGVSTLRIGGSSAAPWLVWKTDDQQDRDINYIDPYLRDENYLEFNVGGSAWWAPNSNSESSGA